MDWLCQTGQVFQSASLELRLQTAQVNGPMGPLVVGIDNPDNPEFTRISRYELGVLSACYSSAANMLRPVSSPFTFAGAMNNAALALKPNELSNLLRSRKSALLRHLKSIKRVLHKV